MLAHEDKCVTCPSNGSATCDNGILKLNVGGATKYWAPPLDMYLWDGANDEWADSVPPGAARQALDASLEVFECLGKGLGCTNTSGSATSPPDFACSPGYSGALCAVCEKGRFFDRGGECAFCDENDALHADADGKASTSSIVGAVLACIAVVLLSAYTIKYKAKPWLRMMRRARRRRRRLDRSMFPNRTGAQRHTLRKTIMKSLLKFVKATKRDKSPITESWKILEGLAQVIFHLYATLQWCIKWPQSLSNMLSVFGWVALDVMKELKLSCHWDNWDVYSSITAAVAFPLALVVVVPAVVIPVKVACAPEPRRGRTTEPPPNTVYLAALSSVGIVARIFDLAYPTIMRTITSGFVCRKLGPAGWHLESNYGTKCYDKEYNGYLPLMILFALLYGIGCPALLQYMIHYYKGRGMLRNKEQHPEVDAALGWVFKPYRKGYEFWHAIESLRKLLLTSAVAFIARESCSLKMLAAELIALVWLLAFLWVRPFELPAHNVLQSLAMLVPVLSTSYGLTGLLDDANERDSYALWALHLVVLIPFILGGLFVICSALYLAIKEACRDRDQIVDAESGLQRLSIGNNNSDSDSDSDMESDMESDHGDADDGNFVSTTTRRGSEEAARRTRQRSVVPGPLAAPSLGAREAAARARFLLSRSGSIDRGQQAAAAAAFRWKRRAGSRRRTKEPTRDAAPAHRPSLSRHRSSTLQMSGDDSAALAAALTEQSRRNSSAQAQQERGRRTSRSRRTSTRTPDEVAPSTLLVPLAEDDAMAERRRKQAERRSRAHELRQRRKAESRRMQARSAGMRRDSSNRRMVKMMEEARARQARELELRRMPGLEEEEDEEEEEAFGPAVTRG